MAQPTPVGASGPAPWVAQWKAQQAAKRPKTAKLVGNDVLREYVYIDDLVNAYLFLAENVERHYGGDIPRTGRATYGWAAYNVGSFISSEGKKPDFFHAASHILARSPSSRGNCASDSDTWTALSVEMNTRPIASLSGVIAVLWAW